MKGDKLSLDLAIKKYPKFLMMEDLLPELTIKALYIAVKKEMDLYQQNIGCGITTPLEYYICERYLKFLEKKGVKG